MRSSRVEAEGRRLSAMGQRKQTTASPAGRWYQQPDTQTGTLETESQYRAVKRVSLDGKPATQIEKCPFSDGH